MTPQNAIAEAPDRWAPWKQSAKLTMRSSLRNIVPLIPSGADFDAELAFFIDHMGFRVLWRAEGMAGIAHDNVAFNLGPSRVSRHRPVRRLFAVL